MDQYMSRKFDRALSELTGDGLSWLPWVGKGYSLSNRQRLLVVGESHYCNLPGAVAARKAAQDHGATDTYTRGCISDYEITDPQHIRTFQNMKRAFIGQGNVDSVEFWSRVAFYNFVQREMVRNSHRNERPNGLDYFQGWKVFLNVVRVLKPTHCVFIGVTAFNSFEIAMGALGLPSEPVKRLDRIGGTHGRMAGVGLGDKRLKMVGIQHAGGRFSWSKWHGFLQRNCEIDVFA